MSLDYGSATCKTPSRFLLLLTQPGENEGVEKESEEVLENSECIQQNMRFFVKREETMGESVETLKSFQLSCSNHCLEYNMLTESNLRPNSEYFNIQTEASFAKKHKEEVISEILEFCSGKCSKISHANSQNEHFDEMKTELEDLECKLRGHSFECKNDKVPVVENFNPSMQGIHLFGGGTVGPIERMSQIEALNINTDKKAKLQEKGNNGSRKLCGYQNWSNKQFAELEVGYDYSFLNPDYDFGLLEEKKLLDVCFSHIGS